MKRIIIMLFAVFSIEGSINSQQNTDYGEIYIIRPLEFVGGLTRVNIYINGELICRIPNGSKVKYTFYEDGIYSIGLGYFIKNTGNVDQTAKPFRLARGERYFFVIDLSKTNEKKVQQAEASYGRELLNNISNVSYWKFEGPRPEEEPMADQVLIEPGEPEHLNHVAVNKETAIKSGVPIKKSDNLKIMISDIDYDIPVNDNQYKNRFALIIGNEDYSSKNISLAPEVNVDYAVNDAIVFMQYAKSLLGIPVENLIIMENGTSIEMQKAINKLNLIAKNMKGEAELFFYYSGHGLPDYETREPYLIPVDVSGSDMNFAIPLKDVYKKLTEFSTKRTTVFLDACFSGGARNSSLLASRSIRIKPKPEELQGKLVVFSASENEQPALSYREKGHGIFTYFLLKKLKETEGKCTYSDLAEYLNQIVGIKSLLINNVEQNPQTSISEIIKNEWENWNFN
jgi:hypothetical protein